MSQIIKCDITGKSDVPTLNVGGQGFQTSGERLTYITTIHNINGYHAIDVAEEYVLEELIKSMTIRLNELRNPASNQSVSNEPLTGQKITAYNEL